VGGLGLVARRRWARLIAPAVFLLAVTGVVLVVRSALRSDSAATPQTTRHATTAKAKAGAHGAPPAALLPAQYYLIQSGDTLDAIASRFGTTVDKLLALNPGTEPTTLRPGERIRIK
jgi:LysM repeat protein